MKIKSNDLSSEKNLSKPTINMKNYLKMVEDRFKPTNKMYVLVQLYNELTIRDDFAKLQIVNKKQDMKDTGNFVYLNNTFSYGEILLNDHKTKSKYGVIKHKLSKEINKLIKIIYKLKN